MLKHHIIGLSLAVLVPLSPISAQLHGSRTSVRRQHKVAERNDFTFLRSAEQVKAFVRKDLLVPVRSSRHLMLYDASFPYTRPQVKLFVERLAAQYHAATGERLVVTSLTRPISRQPDNASPLSVHPAGMAVDFRIPRRSKSRRWLESTLLYLEDQAVLDATRETSPAHYHVAVFPKVYESYVARRLKKAAKAN